MSNMQFHPLADVLPLMSPDEFDALVQDIKLNGVKNDIVIYEGKILDGRNRYRAAKIAGKPCPMRTFANGNPVAFVHSQNVVRRHLTPSQLALIAAKFATLPRGRPVNTPDGAFNPDVKTIEEAAAIFGVSRRSVDRARRVLREATAEQVGKIESGEDTLGNLHDNVLSGRPRARNEAERKERDKALGPAPPRGNDARVRHYLEKLNRVEHTCRTMNDVARPVFDATGIHNAVASITRARRYLGQLLRSIDAKQKGD